jgi:hypothetical protein
MTYMFVVALAERAENNHYSTKPQKQEDTTASASATTAMEETIVEEEVFDDTEETDWLSESAPAHRNQDKGTKKERFRPATTPPTKTETTATTTPPQAKVVEEEGGVGDGLDVKEEKKEWESTVALGHEELTGTKKDPLTERRAERVGPLNGVSPSLNRPLLDRSSTAPTIPNMSRFDSTTAESRRISMPDPDVSGSSSRHLNSNSNHKSTRQQSQSQHSSDDRIAVLSAQQKMIHNQEQTIQAINDLSQTMKNLFKAQLKRDKESEEESKDCLNVDRATVRLDGLEVYAVVSALTVATAIACFDLYGSGSHGDITTIFTTSDITWQNFVPLILNTIFLAVSGLGIIAGLHATLVFSLMTMYGRTAVGVR